MLTLKVISLYETDETCREIELSAGSINGAVVDSRHSANNLAEQLQALGLTESCDALFIESVSNLPEEVFLALKSHIERLSESMAVYVVMDQCDVKTLRALLKAGVRDVFTRPIDKSDVITQLSEISASKRERIMNAKGGLSSVYAFTNAKGGSGATTLAVNFAVELSKMNGYKVALVDFDLQVGACDALLDISSSANVYDAISQSERVDAVFIKALMTQYESGLDVLPSPGKMTSLLDVSVEDIRRVLDALAECYDIVVLDIPNVILPWTTEALRMSERIMLVMQNEFSAIKDARVFIDHIPSFGIPVDRIEIINNRACAKSPAASIPDLKDTLGVSRIHRIRSDFNACINAHSQGKPVSRVSASSKMVKDTRRLAEYAMLGFEHPGEDPVVYRDASFWRKLAIR